MLGYELRKIVLEEDETRNIFKRLHIRVRLELCLPKECLHSTDRRFVVPNVIEYRRSSIGMVCRQGPPPVAVSGAASGKLSARNGPTPDVLTPSRQPKHLGRVGCKPIEPIGHATSIDEFLRLECALERHAIRILGVRLVEAGERLSQSCPWIRRGQTSPAT